ncbi:MAG: undecaprenyl/decaprenyl-phosphate alpha-N-acetylglucosaminyl 1-phosphate transferase [Nitrospirales bacterium]|nr:undecaprenyl/decaprenyl-phosphate alpha-N-acetylglucosaminyl 1-phosphate transferase [Nitrospira sp.]MDR4502068.1 undecaprenyl/decaprenyl-phosphate alpha-N-acetylglucosaminyl 1-phosphate transferase [Nitrospirales bacterium]
MSSSLFYTFFSSLIIGTLLTPIFIVAANHIGLVDRPGHRKVHKEPVARVGGLAFAMGALIAIGIWGIGHPIMNGIFLGIIIIVVVGSLDDYADLQARHKLFAQFFAAAITTIYSHLTWQPLSGMVETTFPPWLLAGITMTTLVLLTNAINFSDGLDGLAGGLTFLSFGVMAYIAYQINDVVVLFLTLPVMGGLLGFLRFNTYPARVFMGDSGSQFLGFLMGVVAILLTSQDRTPFSPLLLLYFAGLPLLDMIAVTAQRIYERKSPFQADSQHLHHKLLAIGFSHHQAVLIIYIFQSGMILLGYNLRWAPDLLLAGVYLLLLLSIGMFFYFAMSKKLQAGTVKTASADILYWRTWFRSIPWLSRWCVYGLGIGVFGFLLFGLTIASNIPFEITASIMGLVLLLMIGLLFSQSAISLITRMGLYLGCTFVLYLTQEFLTVNTVNVHVMISVFFGLLVVLLLLAIHLDETKQFLVNPMDYLLLFLAVVIPFLPDILMGGINLGLLLARLIILFFCCEVLLQAFADKVYQFGYLSALILLGIGLQGLL